MSVVSGFVFFLFSTVCVSVLNFVLLLLILLLLLLVVVSVCLLLEFGDAQMG